MQLIYDQSAKLTDDTFLSHLQALNHLTKDAPKEWAHQEEVLRQVPLFHEMRSVPNTQSPFWTLSNPGPAVNHFQEGDLTSLAKHTTYDLITAFFTMITLDLDDAMAEISARLEEGGTFVMMGLYWWYPYLLFGVAGEFPYAFQQLDGEDLTQYIETYHGEDKQFLIERIDAFRRHTINAYITAAERYDLSIIGVKRYLQTEDTGDFRGDMSPQFMGRHPDVDLNQVVETIKPFQPDIQVLDLLTAFFTLVFRKKTKKQTPLSEHFKTTP